jgi:hypothetical protein
VDRRVRRRRPDPARRHAVTLDADNIGAVKAAGDALLAALGGVEPAGPEQNPLA